MSQLYGISVSRFAQPFSAVQPQPQPQPQLQDWQAIFQNLMAAFASLLSQAQTQPGDSWTRYPISWGATPFTITQPSPAVIQYPDLGKERPPEIAPDPTIPISPVNPVPRPPQTPPKVELPPVPPQLPEPIAPPRPTPPPPPVEPTPPVEPPPPPAVETPTNGTPQNWAGSGIPLYLDLDGQDGMLFVDRNQDGTLTDIVQEGYTNKTGYENGASQFIADARRWDKNGDGTLDAEDLKRADAAGLRIFKNGKSMSLTKAGVKTMEYSAGQGKLNWYDKGDGNQIAWLDGPAQPKISFNGGRKAYLVNFKESFDIVLKRLKGLLPAFGW